MITRFARILALASAIIALGPDVLWAADPELNSHCPVMTDRRSKAEFTVEYEGKTVRFCCEDCRDEFLANPKAYLSNVTEQHTASSSSATVARAAKPTKPAPSAEPLDVIFSFVERHPLPLFAALLAFLGVAMRIGSRKLTGPGAAMASRVLRAASHPAVLSTVWLAVFAHVQNTRIEESAAELAEAQHELRVFQYSDDVHGATFYEFGDPPAPYRPPTLPPRLESTWYRGNDERSPELRRGGHYRTATFHLALIDEGGRPVRHGDDVTGKELFVRFEIRRAPHTAAFFFDDRLIKKIFLTPQFHRSLGYDEPIKEQLPLTTLESLWRWEARYSLGRVSGRGVEKMDSTMYLCEFRMRGELKLGARYHYAIVHGLTLEDGRVAGNSDLWMGTLYRSKIMPFWRIPMNEWFSHEPIPELDGDNTNDPNLLGIPDYADRK